MGYVPTRFFDAAVLAGHRVLISPSSLGSNMKLLQMAEELGAETQTWRDTDELIELLREPAAVVARAERQTYTKRMSTPCTNHATSIAKNMTLRTAQRHNRIVQP